MKVKKLIAGLLSVVMLFSLTGNFTSAAAAPADRGSEAGSYHYDQLDALAQTIYQGIEEMDLQTGTDEYDLVGHGLSGSSLPGSTELNQAMNAARYAYYADHPEVFYVSFPKLTLRTTQDTDGNKHIYIGSGRNANYLIDAFSSKEEVEQAVGEFNTRVAEIVDGAKALTPENGKSLQAEQIRYVHNEIISHVAYRLEDSAAEGNAPFLGTPYGVLIKKQGVCEGYARAFKTVMDQLGVNCILVQGVHQYDGEVAVNHMWNYVEITDAAATLAARAAGGKWYAVDATLDDPEIPAVTEYEVSFERNKYHNQFATYGDDGFEQEKYLLAGQLTMNGKHFEAEEVNAAGGYHFTYPVLEDDDFAITSVSNDLDGFIVKTKDVTGAASGQTITEYQFSYLGMTVSEAKEKGIYLVWRYYKEENGEVVPVYSDYGSWFYLDPDTYVLKQENGFTSVQEGKMPYVEIAATTVPPEKNPPANKPYANLTYQGDDSGLIARTGKIYNQNQTNYTPPPFIRKQSPTQTATINISDRFYHVIVEYDEALEKVSGKNGDETRIECYDRLGTAVTGAEYSQIKNFQWDGDRTVEFDMKFSMMYADDNTVYNIYLEGLAGKTSKKAPNPITYTTRQKTLCPCVMKRNGNWDIFGKPTLLEGDDLSVNDWQMSNGQNVSDLLKDRLTLVTTQTTKKQNEQIQDQIEGEIEEEIVKSATYNITLSICKAVVIHTGDKVKVRIGFPEGFGPDDEGVTFKAYHFKRDSQGNVTGVEEIDCVVTQYGLIITCDAFSPFMIAEVKKDENAAEAKTVVVTTSDGGTVIGSGLDASGIVKLEEGESQTVTFTPHEGYQIESVTVCGKEIEVTNKASATVTVSCDDVQNANNIVNANFVAKEVAQKEEQKGQTPVKPNAEPAQIRMPASMSVSSGGTLTIKPTVAEQSNSVQTFQWYKDGVKLEGKINKNLEIKNVTSAAAGKYTLAVTTTVDTVSAESRSSECVVTVTASAAGGSGSSCSHEETEIRDKKEPTTTEPGYTGDTYCKDCGELLKEGEEIPMLTGTAFTDVEKGEYYYDAVLWAVEKEITSGITATTFRPDMACTRAHMVTFLWRAAGSPKATGSNPFTDVKEGDYYYDAVLWAVEKGITSGITATTFRPEMACTRAHAVTFLYRAKGSPASTGSSFTDVPAGAYYADAVSWAVAENITAGMGNNKFSPAMNCTRGQSVTFLYRDAQKK